MFLLYLPRVRFGQIAFSDEIFPVRLHILFVDRSDVTFEITPCEIVGGSRCPIFEPFPYGTGVGICDGDQEVRGSLTIGRFEPEIDEVLASKIHGAKIGHATFVNKADLVEKVAYALRSLIGSKGSSDASGVCGSAESGGKLQSC